MGLPYKGKNHTALRAPLYIGKNCRFSVLQLLAHCSPIAQILSNPIVSLSLYLGTTQRSFHNFLILNIIILCHPSSDRFLSIQNRPPNAQLPRHLIASSFSNRSTITQQLLTHRSTPSSSYRFSIASLRFSTASPPHVCVPLRKKRPERRTFRGEKGYSLTHLISYARNHVIRVSGVCTFYSSSSFLAILAADSVATDTAKSTIAAVTALLEPVLGTPSSVNRALITTSLAGIVSGMLSQPSKM